MTIELDDTDKLKVLRDDAMRLGVQFEAPDVNAGVYRFEPVSDTLVRYGLGAIKGTGQGAIEAIVAARTEGGAFSSLFDFACRVDRRAVNKRVVEALVKAGAFDALHPRGFDGRAELLASIGLAFEFADTQVANEHQGGLFDDGHAHGSATREPALNAAVTWDVKTRLGHEKVAIGYFLSGHLFDQYEPEVRRFSRRRIAELSDSRDPQLLSGIVSDLRVVNGQRGRVAIFKLDDKTDAIEAVVAEELLNAQPGLFKDDELLVVQGKVQPDRFSGGLRLNIGQAWSLADARCRFGRYLRARVNGVVPPIDKVLQDHPACRDETDQGTLVRGLGIRLVVERDEAIGELDLGEAARFYPSDEALQLWSRSTHGTAEIVYGDTA